jgi:hypothetical protein
MWENDIDAGINYFEPLPTEDEAALVDDLETRRASARPRRIETAEGRYSKLLPGCDIIGWRWPHSRGEVCHRETAGLTE